MLLWFIGLAGITVDHIRAPPVVASKQPGQTEAQLRAWVSPSGPPVGWVGQSSPDEWGRNSFGKDGITSFNGSRPTH